MARIKGSGIKFDRKQVEKLAAMGCTINQIADSLGTNRHTFLRIKREDAQLNSAYIKGIERLAARQGREVTLKSGSLRIVNPNAEPARVQMSVEQRIEMVAEHLFTSPRENTFHAIRRSTMLSSDDVSEAMLNLILETGRVRAVRDADHNFRYFLIPTAVREIKPNGIRSYERKPTGISNKQTQWQAAY